MQRRLYACLTRSFARILLVSAVAALAPTEARAQFARGPRLSLLASATVAHAADPSLSLRAMMLEENLCSLQKPMRKYTYAWISGLSAVLVAQGAVALALRNDDGDDARATRGGLYVAMGMTVGGIVALAAMRKPEIRGCDEWRAMAADASVSLRERVAFGEARLARSELAAKRQTGWWLHAVAVALGAGVGLGLGLGFPDNALRATVQGFGTFALTEARILTRPTRAQRFQREYRALRGAPTSAPLKLAPFEEMSWLSPPQLRQHAPHAER